MAVYYTYLISTLPSFQFGMKPPFSFERFIVYAARFIPDADIEILKKVSITPEYENAVPPILKRWQNFDTALRNELVGIRAGHKRIEPLKYLRQDLGIDTSITHIALSAHRTLSILEAERMLDEERWRFLDGISFGHYFDRDFLIIYALKLLILERWERFNSAYKEQVLEETLQKD